MRKRGDSEPAWQVLHIKEHIKRASFFMAKQIVLGQVLPIYD